MPETAGVNEKATARSQPARSVTPGGARGVRKFQPGTSRHTASHFVAAGIHDDGGYLLSFESQPDGVPDGMFFMNASTAWICPP